MRLVVSLLFFKDGFNISTTKVDDMSLNKETKLKIIVDY